MPSSNSNWSFITAEIEAARVKNQASFDADPSSQKAGAIAGLKAALKVVEALVENLKAYPPKEAKATPDKEEALENFLLLLLRRPKMLQTKLVHVEGVNQALFNHGVNDGIASLLKDNAMDDLMSLLPE